MSNNILFSTIKMKISEIKIEDGSIVVLKGIPMKTVAPECKCDHIEDVVGNPLTYFIKIVQERKFITFEEYLLLRTFIITQYKHIYILNNNIYMNQYPIDTKYSDKVKNGLLTHFAESENDYDDSPIGDIDELIGLYDGLKEYHGILIGAYCNDKVVDDSKIENINLFDYEQFTLPKVESLEGNDFIDIKDESDYVELVRRVFNEPEELYIRTINYSGDTERLNNHLEILAKNWSDYTEMYSIQPQEIQNKFEHRDEYTNILKKYWGYDRFRNFEVYDLNKLDGGKKVTTKVSQEQIISDLVQQVENCADDNKQYRDVFVTAPTGAGKSVIFQVPAIYLAETYNLLTIVVSPLIGLMNDQINSLEKKNYTYAKTINSDISPIVKQEILENVAEGKYHILYLSPETLLARSDVEQLIGDRTIGMIIIDEAHIVTTWGKQFRPDYWYLGDHIRKLRKNQIEKKGRSFVIGTFTATAIYRGTEDMYAETKNSLHMMDPITYLGYIKRNDINIVIDTKMKPNNKRSEYETDKFDEIIEVIKRAIITGKKTLVYFPTVKLIDECFQYIENKKMADSVVRYYGPLRKDVKDENYHLFLDGKKKIMFATKAFGMGIDIDDIELVVHFAPTGNVCDYVQEIGRAARRSGLTGEAYYHYDSHDFKYINRLHGLSTIKKYQLIEVVKKIDELFTIKRNDKQNIVYTKRRNAMLVDAENFSYIFDNPISNPDDDNINKVKTALLIIQKDFEGKIGFSPINVRPVPLFSMGFFAIEPNTQRLLLNKYNDCLYEINSENHICRVDLEKIWNSNYRDKSFPQFKYLLYSRDKELDFNNQYTIIPALCVDVKFADDYISSYRNTWNVLRKVVHDGILKQTYISSDVFQKALMDKGGFGKYKAQAICEVIFASMDIYSRKYAHKVNMKFGHREQKNGTVKYLFDGAMEAYFGWVDKGFDLIQKETKEGHLYIVNSYGQQAKEISIILGILESLDIVSFKMTGGANSQLYIYINQVRNLKNIVNNPGNYDNRLLDIVGERHLISVKMLTYIYESGFKSEQIWDILEDYFLGIVPDKVKTECIKEDPNIVF